MFGFISSDFLDGVSDTKTFLGGNDAYIVKVSTSEALTFLITKENGIIESGFLIGKAATDVTVEMSRDGGDYVSALGNSNWKFQLPTASKTWKQGSLLHFRVAMIRVRIKKSKVQSHSNLVNQSFIERIKFDNAN